MSASSARKARHLSNESMGILYTDTPTVLPATSDS